MSVTTGRFLILQVVLAGVVFGLYLLGDLALVKMSIVPIIGFVFICALLMCGTKRWEAAHWLGEQLPLIGLVGTVLSIVITIHESGDISGQAGRDALIKDIIYSLIANAAGIASLLWIRITMKVCGANDVSEE